jgi:histone deacetylase 1/2
MPTLVLQNQSPFECLFNRTPDYDFLCTFGCLCFPFLRPYHAHKLDFRSSPYVFLGYSFSHLGYRCLDSASQRIYVSRHVRFHENVFRLSTASKTPSYFLTAHTLAQLDHPPQFSPGCPTKCLT